MTHRNEHFYIKLFEPKSILCDTLQLLHSSFVFFLLMGRLQGQIQRDGKINEISVHDGKFRKNQERVKNKQTKTTLFLARRLGITL